MGRPYDNGEAGKSVTDGCRLLKSPARRPCGHGRHLIRSWRADGYVQHQSCPGTRSGPSFCAGTGMGEIDTSLQEFGEFLLKATLATRAPETRATHAAP
jgi:hypothetical protein